MSMKSNRYSDLVKTVLRNVNSLKKQKQRNNRIDYKYAT